MDFSHLGFFLPLLGKHANQFLSKNDLLMDFAYFIHSFEFYQLKVKNQSIDSFATLVLES